MHSADLQRMVPSIAAVREVQELLQLKLLVVGALDLVDGGRTVAEHVVHGHVDEVTIDGPGSQRVTDPKSRPPQLHATTWHKLRHVPQCSTCCLISAGHKHLTTHSVRHKGFFFTSPNSTEMPNSLALSWTISVQCKVKYIGPFKVNI